MRLLSVFLLSFYTWSFSAQLLETTRYADDSGLPSRIVRDIIQDRKGFIWVAGNNGLFKFDGKIFKPYKAALKDTIGLRDNKINTILEASDGKIWIGTPKGLHTLENNVIRHVKLIENPSESQQHVLAIFQDKDDRLWVGTYGGLFMIDKENNPLHFLSENISSKVSEETIWNISQDDKGRIWVATNDIPYILNDEQGFSFTPVSVLHDKDFEIENIGLFQYEHHNDSIVFIGSSKGLLKGTLRGNTLHVARFMNSAGIEAAEDYVQDFAVNENGVIWIAAYKKGLKKYKLSNGHLTTEKITSKNGLHEMTGDSKAVYIDRQKNIWVANTNGLYKLSETRDEILTFPPRYEENCLSNLYGIYAILEDKKGFLWVTTPTALYRFVKKDLFAGNCPTDYLYYEDENMHLSRYLFIDSKNRLWIGADGGLFVAQLDENQNPDKFIRYTTSDGLPHNWSYQVKQIDENNFWVGNYQGLVKLTLNNGSLKQPEIQVYTQDEDRSGSLVNSQAMTMEYDAHGTLWIGTFSGLSKLMDDDGQGTFTNYISTVNNFKGLSNNSIKKIFRDANHNLWIATQRGLSLYMPDTDEFLQFGHAEGLPSEYILGIAQDTRGFLWICTTNGVLRTEFDQISRKFINSKHYTSQDGLVDNIPYRNAIMIDAKDNVFIGSRDGISILGDNSDAIEVSNFELALTNLENIGKKDDGFSSVYDRVLNNELKLSHQENSIKVNYVALDFLKPEYNKYRHKFLPSNDSWVETGNNSELTYYNLPPGDYQLLLDGSDSMGNWSENPIHLKLSISPPFWKSNWAYVLYMLVFLGLLKYMYNVRVRQKEREFERKAQVQTAIIEEREQLRQENTADFHDELGSMVTKISLFLTMAERSWQEKEDPTPFFEKIRTNVKGLSTGFRDLLWVIDPQKDTLADTFLRLKDFGEDLFDNSEINFSTSKFEDDFSNHSLDPQTKKQVVMIFKEAMTNCLKYCDGSKAKLHLSNNGKYSKMQFFDDGSGFNVEKKSKGRGLKNMKVRAAKIKADLLIESSSKGTLVQLDRIPRMGDTFSLQDG